MKYSEYDHLVFLRACADSRATPIERDFLSEQASQAAALEHVPTCDYLHAQALIGGALSTITPIFDRQMKFTLSTGTVIESKMDNGATSADLADGSGMTQTEHAEYCAYVQGLTPEQSRARLLARLQS